MNNNKTESYQKLRALYEKKYLPRERAMEMSDVTANRIKFRKTQEKFGLGRGLDLSMQLSQQSGKSNRQLLQSSIEKRSNSNSKSYRPQISIEYMQFERESQSVDHNRRPKGNAEERMAATCRSKGKRNNNLFENYKTIVFPGTSRDFSSPSAKIKQKKYSLIEMIEELKNLKQVNHSKIAYENFEKKQKKVYESYQGRRITECLKPSTRPKKAKLSTSYYHSSKMMSKSHRETASKPMENDSKYSQIDPWIVNESEFQGKKFY